MALISRSLRDTSIHEKLITTGDFGESIIYTGKSANDVIKANAPISAKIGIIVLVLQVGIGIPLGLGTALGRGKCMTT